MFCFTVNNVGKDDLLRPKNPRYADDYGRTVSGIKASMTRDCIVNVNPTVQTIVKRGRSLTADGKK